MYISMIVRRGAPSTAAALAFFLTGPVSAQEIPPGPVRYTVAREHPVQRIIRLSGSVESSTVSLVASEVDGMVIEVHAREGDMVRKGATLARLRETAMELDRNASAAQLKEAEARLKLAERSLVRAQELFDSQVLSQQELDAAFFEMTAWQGRVEQLTAAIARIDHDIELCTIRAPFAGSVVAEHAEVGEWISVGDTVVEIASLSNLEVKVEVPERYFHSMRKGSKASITFDTIPGYQLDGKVDTIIQRADPQARTFPLKVALRNTNGSIGVGMLAQVSMPAGDTHNAIIVPKDAVVGDGANQHVFRIGADSTVERVPVQTGQGIGDWIVIDGGIAAGEQVVTRGNERLSPGQPVAGEPLEYALP
ncbi:MAG TPA: efflux RND transporter periplasmic adaptor subunit [Candidatus Polarisedimenticolia bacterium]|nr:efflux RND transporter periplasmic adaptor subunit [Candidatus Polarisedimenticolia bacterium]